MYVPGTGTGTRYRYQNLNDGIALSTVILNWMDDPTCRTKQVGQTHRTDVRHLAPIGPYGNCTGAAGCIAAGDDETGGNSAHGRERPNFRGPDRLERKWHLMGEVLDRPG